MEKPRNHRQPWEQSEEDELVRMVESGADLGQISRAPQRTGRAVQDRIKPPGKKRNA